MTSREAAIVAFGEGAVISYELVKTFYTRYGHRLEESFAEAVGGRVGRNGEPDVVTRLGPFEFCAAANTKNAAGHAADLARVGPGRIVQVSGSPRPGRISGEQFLTMHGIRNAERVAGECQIRALQAVKAEAVEHARLEGWEIWGPD